MANDHDSEDQESPQQKSLQRENLQPESPQRDSLQQDSSSKEAASSESPSKNGQIPLLDDVVFNTELPFPKPKPPARQKPLHDENAPRATDLFGGSPETAQSGPLSNHDDSVDIDKITQQVKDRTDRVVDSIVAEYSHEIIERLRNELTAVLEDLRPELPEDLQNAVPEELSAERPETLLETQQEKPDQT